MGGGVRGIVGSENLIQGRQWWANELVLMKSEHLMLSLGGNEDGSVCV